MAGWAVGNPGSSRVERMKGPDFELPAVHCLSRLARKKRGAGAVGEALTASRPAPSWPPSRVTACMVKPHPSSGAEVAQPAPCIWPQHGPGQDMLQLTHYTAGTEPQEPRPPGILEACLSVLVPGVRSVALQAYPTWGYNVNLGTFSPSPSRVAVKHRSCHEMSCPIPNSEGNLLHGRAECPQQRSVLSWE